MTPYFVSYNNSFILRNAEESDLPDILKILNHEILNGTAIYYYDVRSLDDLESFLNAKKLSKMPLLVAVFKGEIFGYGTFDAFHPYKGYQFSVEHSNI